MPLPGRPRPCSKAPRRPAKGRPTAEPPAAHAPGSPARRAYLRSPAFFQLNRILGWLEYRLRELEEFLDDHDPQSCPCDHCADFYSGEPFVPDINGIRQDLGTLVHLGPMLIQSASSIIPVCISRRKMDRRIMSRFG
ncbi:MAG TPA: hypothetical protein VKE74_19530 [Gemmataceae bacterium]|nr:hypothetical protein [Gemmataceae bacterium]